MGFYAYFNFIILVNLLDRSREDSKDERMHLSDAVLESVVVFRLAAGAVAEVVVPLGESGLPLWLHCCIGHRCCDRGYERGTV